MRTGADYITGVDRRVALASPGHEPMHQEYEPDTPDECPRCGGGCEVWATEPYRVLYCEACRELWHVGIDWPDVAEHEG